LVPYWERKRRGRRSKKEIEIKKADFTNLFFSCTSQGQNHLFLLNIIFDQ
jgi:hypothetical protein